MLIELARSLDRTVFEPTDADWGLPSPPIASLLVKDREMDASPTARARAVRVQRIRKDAQRPISVNFAETIALSHKLARFAGAARQS